MQSTLRKIRFKQKQIAVSARYANCEGIVHSVCNRRAVYLNGTLHSDLLTISAVFHICVAVVTKPTAYLYLYIMSHSQTILQFRNIASRHDDTTSFIYL